MSPAREDELVRSYLVGDTAADLAERMRLEDTPSSPRDKLRAIGLGYIGFALAERGWFDVAFASTRGR